MLTCIICTHFIYAHVYYYPTLVFLPWSQYARTEWIQNNLNPEFSKSIEMVYKFEEVQRLKFLVYDIDNESVTLDDDDFLGSMQCTLAEVCTSVRVRGQYLMYACQLGWKVNGISQCDYTMLMNSENYCEQVTGTLMLCVPVYRYSSHTEVHIIIQY